MLKCGRRDGINKCTDDHGDSGDAAVMGGGSDGDGDGLLLCSF